MASKDLHVHPTCVAACTGASVELLGGWSPDDGAIDVEQLWVEKPPVMMAAQQADHAMSISSVTFILQICGKQPRVGAQVWKVCAQHRSQAAILSACDAAPGGVCSAMSCPRLGLQLVRRDHTTQDVRVLWNDMYAQPDSNNFTQQQYHEECSYGKAVFAPSNNVVVETVLQLGCSGMGPLGTWRADMCRSQELYGWMQAAVDQAQEQVSHMPRRGGRQPPHQRRA
eukprot:354314-Chlamydomonas_euryale.AAC.19